MIKKKGALYLVLFLLVVSSVISLEELNLNTNKFSLLNFGKADLESDDSAITLEDLTGESDETLDVYGTDFNSGCWGKVEEDDGSSDGDTHEEKILTGYQLYPYGKKLKDYMVNSDDGTSGAQEVIESTKVSTEDGNAYICASDNWWYICSLEEGANGQGSMIWIINPSFVEGDLSTVNTEGEVLFVCAKDDEERPEWQPIDIDADGDGYTKGEGDCANNPFNKDLQTVDCPPHGHPELCSFPRDSRCAICIGPGAPETCGDGINNDCDNSASEFYENDLDDDTNDDCHKFQAGCEQRSFEELGEEDESLEEDDFLEEEYTLTHLNFNNEKYDWVDMDNDGYCCGYGGINDLGKIVKGQNEGSEKICLNKNDHLLGFENLPEWGTNELGCDDWCWVDAATADTPFRIMTIKKPGEQPYDVVSDSVSWRACNGTEGPMHDENNSVHIDVEEKMVNHFYCYQEGQHWSWAECYGGGDYSYNPNLKGRLAGDSLYSIYLDGALNSEDGSITVTDTKITSESGKYMDFYTLKDLDKKPSYDFSGYDTLDFFVQFVDDSGEKLNPTDIKKPFDLMLQLHGPYKELLSENVLVDQSVLGYAVNPNMFLEGAWTHIKFPIPDNLYAVSFLKFNVGELTKNEVKLKNMYLSKSSIPNPPICSGVDDISRSSWLASFDDGDAQGYVNAQEMCVAHYGLNAWMGSDDQYVTGENNCCGDDEGEYYLGRFVDN